MSDDHNYRHSATTRRVLRSLVPVICPPEAVAIADAIVDHMALTIGASPMLVQKMFGVGLAAYDVGALLRYGRLAHRLTGERAERYYQSWVHGVTPMHVQLARAVNQLMSLSCYEQPAMAEAIGYRPAAWVEQMRVKRLRVYADDVRAQEARILAPDPLRPRRKKEVA
ncbi:MAG: hypothetical protein ACM31C_25115 [Acidobacteriota bacterium]